MPRFSTYFVVVLCWASPSIASDSDLSNYTLDFLSMYTGKFNSLKEMQTGSKKQPSFQLLLKPVDIPALRPAIVVYDEFTVDGKVQEMTIDVFSERPGPSIHATIYNVTENPSLYKPGQFDVSTLRDLQLKDLPASNCTATFKRLSRAVYVGRFPICSRVIDGRFSHYAVTYSCEDLSIVIPPTLSSYTEAPVIFKRQGDRFPLIGLQDNYYSICPRRQSPKITPRY